jgi:hypothetical protein
VLIVHIRVSPGFEIENHHGVEVLIERLPQRHLTVAQLCFGPLTLGNNSITLRNFLFEAQLRFIASRDLLRKFRAQSIELALGSSAQADLILKIPGVARYALAGRMGATVVP